MKNKVFTMRPLVAVLITSMALQGCATHNLKGEKLTPGESFKQTFASEDPCSNNARNIGIVVGVLAVLCWAIMQAETTGSWQR